jgi:DNA-binding CsgD family transcriptional regulator
VRAIYDAEALQIPGALSILERHVAEGEEARTVSGLPMKLLVVDRRLGLVPLRQGEPRFESAIVVHESPLLDAIASLFNTFWERGSALGPIGPVDELAGAPNSAALPHGYAQVLTLLTAGQKEESIARSLGVTRRTVGRRIERMMQVLDVQTRFQLAHKATLCGWLRAGDSSS